MTDGVIRMLLYLGLSFVLIFLEDIIWLFIFVFFSFFKLISFLT